MRPLDDARRKRLLALSAVLCAVPLCLAPLAGRSSFELAGEKAVFDARFSVPEQRNVWSDNAVPVARDPFVPEREAASVLQADAGASNTVVGVRVRQGESMGFALPANSGLAALTVTAIVTGSSPRALVDDGEHVRVVAAGDALAGTRVRLIDRAGIRLENGLLLPLTEEHP